MTNPIFKKIRETLIGKPTKTRTTKLKIDQHETHAKFRGKMSETKFYLTQPFPCLEDELRKVGINV